VCALSSVLYLQELSEKLHKRGLYLGQRIDIDEGNMVNFNNTEVSKLVDWFYIIPAKLDHQGYMEPYTPLTTYNGKSSGTLVSTPRSKRACKVKDQRPQPQIRKAHEVP